MSLDLIAASATFPGLATTGTQTFAGAKTWLTNSAGAVTYLFQNPGAGAIDLRLDGGSGAIFRWLKAGAEKVAMRTDISGDALYIQVANGGKDAAICDQNANWIFGVVASTAPEHRFNLGNSGTGKIRFNLNNTTADAYIGLNGTASGILDYQLNHTLGGGTGTSTTNAGGTFRIDSRDTGGSNLFSWHARGLGTALNIDGVVLSITAAGACKFGQTNTSNASTRHEINGCLAVASPSSNSSESGLFYISSNLYTGANGMGNRYVSTCNGGGIYFDTHTAASVECIGFLGNTSGDTTTTTALLLGLVKPSSAWQLGNSAFTAQHTVYGNIIMGLNVSSNTIPGSPGYLFGCGGAAAAGFLLVGTEPIDSTPAWAGIRLRSDGSGHGGMIEFQPGANAGSSTFNGVTAGYVVSTGSWTLNPGTGNGIFTSIQRLLRCEFTTDYNVTVTSLTSTQLTASVVNSSNLTLTGSPGNFNLDGIVALSRGTVLFLRNNTSNQMTITHNGAGNSTAIFTKTGASVAYGANSTALLIYGSDRWQLIG